MTLGENIVRLRTQKNWSQGDLADALDISRQSVSKWETDASIPELDKLLKLSELFDVTLDELVRGEEVPKTETAPLNTTTLLQKQTLLSQKHRLYLRRILPYQKYHLLRHRSHPSWNHCP